MSRIVLWIRLRLWVVFAVGIVLFWVALPVALVVASLWLLGWL